MALAKERNVPYRKNRLLSLPVAAGAKIYAGALVVIKAAGYAAPASTAVNLVAVGRADRTVDNSSGADGAVTVPVLAGVSIPLKNSAGADLIGQAQIGAEVYIVDDETVAKTSNSNARSKAGRVTAIDEDGVWVRPAFPA